MKNIIKYPRTTSELYRLLNFLDHNFKLMEETKDKKYKSREWMRICQSTNDIRKNALDLLKSSEDKNKEAKTQLSLLKYATSSYDINFHNKVFTTVEKWMMAKKFPIW